MAKVSAKGGFHLLWGLVLSTIISAVGTIFIARLLGADNMGLYTIALAAPNLIATFRDWGVTTAMIKYSAEYNSENDVAKIRSVFVSGLVFEILVGLALAFLSFGLSQFLARLLWATSYCWVDPDRFPNRLNRWTSQRSHFGFYGYGKNASKQCHVDCSILN